MYLDPVGIFPVSPLRETEALLRVFAFVLVIPWLKEIHVSTFLNSMSFVL